MTTEESKITQKIGNREVEEKDQITHEETILSKKPEDTLLPTLIRSELNFLQFPFFALSWRGLKNKIEIEYRHVTERDGKKAELIWRVTANAKYGYPNPFDRRVARALDALIDEILQERGYVENPIRFSIYQIARLMGIPFESGQLYQDIRDSLRRIVVTSVESVGSFFLKDEKRWLHKVFHPYESVVFKGKEMSNGTIADSNYLWLGEEYLRNINAYHVKPLDYQYLASLQSDIASRLYEILSQKFYGLPPDKDHLRISYLNLCEILPITPQKKYSDARRALDPAHKELMRTGYLAKVAFQPRRGKKDRNDFNILYYLGERAKKEKRGEYAVTPPIEEQLWLPLIEEGSGVVQLSELGGELHEKGLSKSAAMKISQNYPEDFIREKMEMFDFLLATHSDLISKNPAGWLRQAIQEDWQPTEEHLIAKEARERQQSEDERRARWIKHRKELIDQEIKDWDKIPLEERIKGQLEFWRYGFKLKKLPNPSQEEIEAKRQELILALPKTEEGKRNYLASRYHLTPPEDFI